MSGDTLHLPLFYRRFWEVRYGTPPKRVEYRVMKPRWDKQIWAKRDTLKTVVLHRVYTSNVVRAEITKIDIGPCPYAGWDGDYYRVHFRLEGDPK